jgi:hypothetical protein
VARPAKPFVVWSSAPAAAEKIAPVERGPDE